MTSVRWHIEWRRAAGTGEDRRMLDRIVPLDPGDLPECLALARDRDWPPEEHKWRLLFTVGTVYGVRDDAGDLVGAAVLTTYGAELAAISMVLVAALTAAASSPPGARRPAASARPRTP